MRILLLTHSYFPESSPPQRRWDSFVYVMQNSGWQVTVVAPGAGIGANGAFQRRHMRDGESGLYGEDVRRIPTFRKSSSIWRKVSKHLLEAAMMLPRALLSPRPNVVIATVPALPTMFIGFFVACLFRRPLILEMRDAWPDLFTDSRVLRLKWLTKLAHLAVGAVQRRAALVVTVTDGFGQVLVREGVRRVHTIPNGISTRNLVPLPHASSHSDSKLHVLYLGNLGESQGLESIIRASTLARNEVSVRIVGGGTASERLRRFSGNLNATIDFQVAARGDVVRAHYQWADTCIVSLRNDWSSFDHTVPSKIYELLSVGRHITGVVKGEAAHIISASEAGDIVDHNPTHIADLWRNLLADRQRLDVGVRGREWVLENASLEKLGEDYMDLVRSITG